MSESRQTRKPLETENRMCHTRLYTRRRHRLPSPLSASSSVGYSATTISFWVSAGGRPEVIGPGSRSVHQMPPRNQTIHRSQWTPDSASRQTRAVCQSESKVLGIEAAQIHDERRLQTELNRQLPLPDGLESSRWIPETDSLGRLRR